MGLATKLSSIFDRVIVSLTVLAIALLAFAWFSICAEVVVRYFFGGAVTWSIEVTEYILLAICFLSGAWLLKIEGHVRVDILTSRLKPRIEAIVGMAVSILGTMLWLVITWYSARATWHLFQVGIRLETLLEPPTFSIMAVIPVGSFLLLIQFARRSYGYFRGLKI